MNDPRSQKSPLLGQESRQKKPLPTYQNISGTNGEQGLESAPDTAAYQRRSDQIEQIEVIFGEFGTVVCSHILTQSLMPGGIKRLTMKLDIPSRGRDGADLAMICKWIEGNGVEAYCKRVGLKSNHPKASLPPTPPPDAPPQDDGSSRLRVVPLGQNSKPKSQKKQFSVSAKSLTDPPSSQKRTPIPPPVTASGNSSQSASEQEKQPEPPKNSGFMFAPKKGPGS